jgi:hypothetical protein
MKRGQKETERMEKLEGMIENKLLRRTFFYGQLWHMELKRIQLGAENNL